MNSRKLHLLLSSTRDYPFIQDDLALLREEFQVEHIVAHGAAAAISNFLGAARSDVSISWFGSVYSFFLVMGASIGGRGSIIILGGVDAACEAHLGYGIWRSRWKGGLLKWSLRRADRVLAVDGSLRDSIERITAERWEQIETLPTGYDPSVWCFNERTERQGVLCVATIDIPQRIAIKGVDIFLAAASLLPSVPFTLIGVHRTMRDEVARMASPNVTILPPVPRSDLLEHYRHASVYCQPSRHEGLPNTLCEAMLCGCVPIGSDVGGIAGAIGCNGIVVKVGDMDALVRGITHALTAHISQRYEARMHIVRNFSREERGRRLLAIIREIVDAKTGG